LKKGTGSEPTFTHDSADGSWRGACPLFHGGLPSAILVAVAAFASAAAAQQPQPPGSQPAQVVQRPATQPSAAPAATSQPAAEPKRAKPYANKGWGARLEPEPPSYVKPLSARGIKGLESLDWLDFGLEHRTRFEHRDDDFRRAELLNDDQFLLRSRAYFGIHDIADPFRFGVEFQDSRQFSSRYPESTQDIDENDILQLFGELYFRDVAGPGYPLRFQFGRMSFDYIDRRLIARNRWRNTTNSFDGFRLIAGAPDQDWQVDVLAVMPVERRLSRPDRSEEERWLYGVVGAWRKWSQVVTFEPYYLILDEDRKDPTRTDREIHTFGLHAFGPIGKTRFDYDVDTAFQVGRDGLRNQCTFAGYGELGYTFQHSWQPRLSFSTAYASGDRDPADLTTDRFDRLFQAGHSWSTADLFNWQNTIVPKLRIQAQPLKPLRLDAAYGAQWLASDSDTWPATGRRDPTGRSGDFLGHEFELRARYQLNPQTEVELGYSYFLPGAFAKNTGPADDSDFFYVAVTFQF